MIFKKHKQFRDITFVVGYVDNHGAVHAQILLRNSPNAHANHNGLFSNNKYKNWRWSSTNGLEQSQSVVNLDEEDCNSVINWLFKNGCLNDWELPK